METIAVKIKITSDLVGKDAIILTKQDNYKAIEYGEYILIKFNKGVDRRSIEQNNLYWACLQLLVENRGDISYSTKEKAHTQVRWGCKYIDMESVTHFPDGKLYFELDSVSFSKANQKKVNEYYNRAFDFMAEALGITVEELIMEAQSRMQSVRICNICGRKATDRHHLFSNTKHNREMYGKLLDDERNIAWLCNGCHVGGASIPKMTEREFCKIMGIEIKSKVLLYK